MSDGETQDPLAIDDLPYGDERSRHYKAARGGKRCLHLMFVPAQGEHDPMLPFHDIHGMEIRKDGRELMIEFSAKVVIMTGQNLRPIASAVGSHGCSCLEAFNPQTRDRPTDKDAPFIDRISFYTRDKKQKDDGEQAKQ